MEKGNFSFNISLSVLNHLGRNLYRSFVTVLGEAISNAWDADAKNVHIYINKEQNSFVITDDGIGMEAGDFQNKFLKIGYSKRKDGSRKSASGRPFIGRKGIGKLALLSCADSITVVSRKSGETEFVGGRIDNSGLDNAIKDDLNASEYVLESWDNIKLEPYLQNFDHGTIILFEGIRGGIKNTLSYIKKIIALYFRFSLLDDTFNLYVDNEKVTYEHIGEIGEKTQFLWVFNDYSDPFIENSLPNLKHTATIPVNLDVQGFIGTVKKPSHLRIRETDEKLTIDLFVNGRLREKDILKNIPSNRIVESYAYGQIHFNHIDDGENDPFTSSREGVISSNAEYRLLLKELKDKIMSQIIEEWDDLRRKFGDDGDSENDKISKKQRKSEELYNAVSGEYSLDDKSKRKSIVDEWVEKLRDDASFCFSSYAECFISENLVRKYIFEKKVPLTPVATQKVTDYRLREQNAKGQGNISIDIREDDNDLSYLAMHELTTIFEAKDPIKTNNLTRDSNTYKPLRDALMHTALLTSVAKRHLNMTYENIRARVKQLLSS